MKLNIKGIGTSIISWIRSIHPKALLAELVFFSRFFVLLLFFLGADFFRIIISLPLIRKFTAPFRPMLSKLYRRVIEIFNQREPGSISSLDLIFLAVRHLKMKKTRTLITIGGMAIGFGSVIFMLSLGYGVQRLVVSQVARLSEMKQIEVATGQTSSLFLNDQSIEDFSNIEGVEEVLPQISLVSRVSYNNSVSDVIAYAVSTRYLEESAIQPTRGRIFDAQDPSVYQSRAPDDGEDLSGVVAGARLSFVQGAAMGAEIGKVRFSIHPLTWKAVYQEPNDTSTLLGYTTRVSGNQEAIEVWGAVNQNEVSALSGIDEFGNTYNRWIQDSFALWVEEECDPDFPDCFDGQYRILQTEQKEQAHATGFISQDSVEIERYRVIESGKPLIEGEVLQQINFTGADQRWISVYSDAKFSSEQHTLKTQLDPDRIRAGDLVLGDSYIDDQQFGVVGQNSNGRELGYWVRAVLPIWRALDCENCNHNLPETDPSTDQQLVQTVYIKASEVNILGTIEPSSPLPSAQRTGSVLGETTDEGSSATTTADTTAATATTGTATSSTGSASLTGPGSEAPVATQGEIDIDALDSLADEFADDEDVDWVALLSAGAVRPPEREIIDLPSYAVKQAVINRAMLNLLGLNEQTAIGQEIEIVFNLSDTLFADSENSAETSPTMYEIVGIIPEERTPAFYLSFGDLKGVGVDNYSQMKVVVKNQNDVREVRQAIESYGYKTSSVVDTVGRINSLFDNIRFVLLLLGMVALSVAALGMFNTLTVSLLEKTREVGLMKAIGMKSTEVKRLFLAESVIMGYSGGIFGLILGFLMGKGLSLVLSVMAITQGVGIIDVAYIPFYVFATILVLSFLIGILTGLYPAKRATSISALNALRYE